MIEGKELYVVIDRSGVLRERKLSDMTLAETVKDIVGGEFDSVAFVFCLNPDEGTMRDVTEDVAREVLNETGVNTGFELRGAARDLVEDRIGIRAAREP